MNILLCPSDANQIRLECYDRRYMMVLRPEFKKSNNKPWYQGHKTNRSKKSRRTS